MAAKGSYTLYLYCDSPTHEPRYYDFYAGRTEQSRKPDAIFNGQGGDECRRQARAVGWRLAPLTKEEATAICPKHSGVGRARRESRRA